MGENAVQAQLKVELIVSPYGMEILFSGDSFPTRSRKNGD